MVSGHDFHLYKSPDLTKPQHPTSTFTVTICTFHPAASLRGIVVALVASPASDTISDHDGANSKIACWRGR